MQTHTNTNGNKQHQTKIHILNWTIFGETPFYFQHTQLKYIFVLFTVLLVYRVQPKLNEDVKKTTTLVILFNTCIMDFFDYNSWPFNNFGRRSRTPCTCTLCFGFSNANTIRKDSLEMLSILFYLELNTTGWLWYD